ncbi:MAG: peptide ABC transporter substrate-binding protein [Epsilonproteobacteria bacterium]|nr:MAG: peptide ABC transporter substrate-binding protein [Campylobacterota bacterium]RLA66174.1 MAG: peptide ABC transporter substrate-binding protein [Campylobacterota bacterium]
MLVRILTLFTLLTSQVFASVGNPKAPKGGVFKYNLGNQPTTLNVLSSTDAYASTVQGYIIESLATINIDTYKFEPALAKSWEKAKDGKSYTFTLREGVKWHDGKPLTIEDVKFSFDAIMDKENRWKTAHSKAYYENISEAKIIGKYKIQFFIKSPYFKNFDMVAGLSIVPKHIYSDLSKKNKKKLNKTLIGTGPYMLAKLRRGKSLILKRNKNWWGDKVPSNAGLYNFDKILMRFIKDGTIAITRLTKGDVDFLGLSAEEFVKKTTGKKWDKKEVFKVKTKNKSPSGYGFIGWNLRNDLFRTKKTRKALYHLLNRDLMIKKFDFGMNLPATGPTYQQSVYANHKVKPVHYDPKLALKMLKEDGWKPGPDNILRKTFDGIEKRLSFTILEPRQEFVKYLTIYKQDALQAGVEVKIKYVEWTTFIKLLDERKFEAVRLGWSGGSVDWDPKQIWHTDSIASGGSNFIGYSNPEVDKLIDQARLTFNKEKRIELLREVYKIIAEDVPYAFFFNAKYRFYAHTKRMKREKDTYQYGIGTDYWWIEK